MAGEDLLNWPVSDLAAADDESQSDPRTTAELRAELAEARRDLDRMRSRLDELEKDNERLARQLSGLGSAGTTGAASGGSPPMRALALASEPPEGDELPLPLAILRRD